LCAAPRCHFLTSPKISDLGARCQCLPVLPRAVANGESPKLPKRSKAAESGMVYGIVHILNKACFRSISISRRFSCQIERTERPLEPAELVAEWCLQMVHPGSLSSPGRAAAHLTPSVVCAVGPQNCVSGVLASDKQRRRRRDSTTAEEQTACTDICAGL
jgi:hypothetical protein